MNNSNYALTTEEQEYLFSGIRADDFYTVEISKRYWTTNRNKWIQAAKEHPDKVSIISENDEYISFKVKKSAVRLPLPNVGTRVVSDENKQKASDRLKDYWKKRKEINSDEIKEINND